MIDVSKLRRDQAVAALEVTENMLGTLCGCSAITKAGEGRALPFENAMVELLLTKWGSATDAAIESALSHLAANAGELLDSEIAAILQIMRDEIDSAFTAQVASELPPLVTGAYQKGKKDALKRFKINAIFGEFDDRAAEWLNDHHMYWVGNYYDKHVSSQMSSFVAEKMQQGLGRSEIGKELASFFEGYPGIGAKPESYWRGFAANGMNRTRNFGLIQGYQEIGITELVVRAIIDERTSPICREMNGKVISIEAAVAQRDRLMQAQNPEDVKVISPWPKLPDIKGKSGEEVAGQGVVMPPYHYHCRTTVEAVYSKDFVPVYSPAA